MTTFLVLRAIFGIGMGGEWGVGASLVMEKVPPRWRGVLSGLLQEGYAFGFLLAAVAAHFILTPTVWRPLFFLGGLPALLALFIRFFVKESAVWQKSKAESWSHLGRAIRGHWRIWIYLTLLMAMLNFASHGTQDIYPTFLKEFHGMSDAKTTDVVMLTMVGAIIGGLAFGLASDRWGRRRMMIVAFAGATCVAPLWAFSLETGWIIAGGFLMQFMVQGAWGIIPAHISELSPDQVRGFLPGFSYQCGNLIAASISWLEATLAPRVRLPGRAGDLRRGDFCGRDPRDGARPRAPRSGVWGDGWLMSLRSKNLLPQFIRFFPQFAGAAFAGDFVEHSAGGLLVAPFVEQLHEIQAAAKARLDQWLHADDIRQGATDHVARLKLPGRFVEVIRIAQGHARLQMRPGQERRRALRLPLVHRLGADHRQHARGNLAKHVADWDAAFEGQILLCQPQRLFVMSGPIFDGRQADAQHHQQGNVVGIQPPRAVMLARDSLRAEPGLFERHGQPQLPRPVGRLIVGQPYDRQISRHAGIDRIGRRGLGQQLGGILQTGAGHLLIGLGE